MEHLDQWLDTQERELQRWRREILTADQNDAALVSQIDRHLLWLCDARANASFEFREKVARP